MPWHALDMRTRAASLVLLLALAACTSGGSEDPGLAPDPRTTTDAQCAVRLPDSVFDTLGWAAPKPAEATVRGCHRETEQGYVEVRDRSGDYAKLCRTLDRSGGVGPGVPADWLTGFTGCAVEPTGDVGQTKVLVKRDHVVTLVTVVALSSTPQTQVRAAVQELLA